MNTWLTAYSRALHSHATCLECWRQARNMKLSDATVHNWSLLTRQWAARCRQYRAAMGGAL